MYMSGLLRYNSNYPQFFHVMSFLLLLCTCSSFLCETAQARMQLIKTAIHFLPKDSHFMSPKDDCNKSATKVHFLISYHCPCYKTIALKGGIIGRDWLSLSFSVRLLSSTVTQD